MSFYMVVEGKDENARVIGDIETHCGGCGMQYMQGQWPKRDVRLFTQVAPEGGPFANVCSDVERRMDKVEWHMAATGSSREDAEKWARWRNGVKHLAELIGVR